MVPSKGSSSPRSRGREERGQANPIGLTLVLGFTVVGAVLILVFGASALSGAEESLNNDRAEKTLTQLDSKAALVALGNTDTQELTFAHQGDREFQVEEGEGWMKLTIDNRSDGSDPKVLLNQSMGSITYESEQSTLAYQGGGVWRKQSENSVMVSPPEFHFRNGTLTLPVVNVTGDGSLSNKATISHRRTTKQFPNVSRDANFTNPLTDHRVKVIVKSDYYIGWGTYFEERTDGKVDYDHENDIVNLTLVTPLEKDTISRASSSLSASEDFILSGTSAHDWCGSSDRNYTDSYDSSVGDYCSQDPGTNGDIVYGGDVDVSSGTGGAYINGDIVAGETVTVSGSNGNGQPYVHGHINYTISCDTSGGGGGPPGAGSGCANRIQPSSAGTVNPIDGVQTSPKIDGIVNQTIYGLKDDNDNAASSSVSTNSLVYNASGDAELTAGDYYVEQIDYSSGAGDRIVFNTTDGDVKLAVRGDVDMPSGEQMEVIGDGTVRVYVGGESSFSDADGWTWEMNGASDVSNAGQDAPQFRVYGTQDFRFRMNTDEDHQFVGAIFAPPGSSGNGEVQIDGGHIFGGILTGTTTINNKGAIHYDEALQNKQIISQGARVVKVTYLHVSINRIEVSG